jgi:hypothetical protein
MPGLLTRKSPVEFAGKDGRAYALLPIAADKLIVLRDEPEFAAA